MSELADSNISMINGIFIKQMVFAAAGQRAMTHAHCYDHQTLLAAGSLRIIVDGIATDYEAPAIVIIEAGKHHGLESLQDGTVAYCIHAIKDSENLVLDIPNDELMNLA